MNKTTFRLLLAIPVLAGAAAACASDPGIVVPNDYHGAIHISFCERASGNPPIQVDSMGHGSSGLCEKSLTKFALKRANGTSLSAPDMQLVTTGDGVVVGANFTVQ
ncbi:hypothetical protein [Acidobacterium sp. S8]|uniref:hypothetical protein n=1 Tax=Acidobacterium sp. S8 TaxID=1641854 RepID=UPI00131C6481|nr:hypothetical protein [Acidobacterium sp. S8]